MENPSDVAAITPMRYGYGRALTVPFLQALERTREALKTEGFGVLCEIDIKEKLKEKLGVAFRNYVILGACNPPIAFETLQREINIGLLLPCNVIVYEAGDQIIVAAIDAAKMVSVTGNRDLEGPAGQVTEKLKRVIDRV